MPDGDGGDEFPPESDEGKPSDERTPADAGPDPSVAGDHPDESTVDGGDADREADAPLSDLRSDVEQRREADTDDAFEAVFTEMDPAEIDEESVWAELSETAERPSVDPSASVASEQPVGETRDVTVVEKRLCHGCPYFADPPETACTHEGTTIDAEVDVDHFRVVDCPVVAEREDAEASDFSAEEP